MLDLYSSSQVKIDFLGLQLITQLECEKCICWHVIMRKSSTDFDMCENKSTLQITDRKCL